MENKEKIVIPSIEIPNITDSQKFNTELLLAITAINTAVNNLQDTQRKHHEILVEGNGEVSIVERLRAAEKFIDDMRYWMKFMIGIVLVNLTASAFLVIANVIKTLP